MLMLSRKPGERIEIGDDIIVVISRVAGNRVKIGIEAPRNVRIIRPEINAADGPATATDCFTEPHLMAIGEPSSRYSR